MPRWLAMAVAIHRKPASGPVTGRMTATRRAWPTAISALKAPATCAGVAELADLRQGGLGRRQPGGPVRVSGVQQLGAQLGHDAGMGPGRSGQPRRDLGEIALHRRPGDAPGLPVLFPGTAGNLESATRSRPAHPAPPAAQGIGLRGCLLHLHRAIASHLATGYDLGEVRALAILTALTVLSWAPRPQPPHAALGARRDAGRRGPQRRGRG